MTWFWLAWFTAGCATTHPPSDWDCIWQQRTWARQIEPDAAPEDFGAFLSEVSHGMCARSPRDTHVAGRAGAALDEAWRRSVLSGPFEDMRGDPWARVDLIERSFRSDPWRLRYVTAIGDWRNDAEYRMTAGMWQAEEKFLDPKLVPLGLGWSYVHLGRDFLEAGDPAAAAQAFWVSVGVASRLVGARPDQERLRAAGFDGLARSAEARGLVQTAQIHGLARDLALTWLSTEEATLLAEGWHERYRDAIAAERRAEQQQKAANAAFWGGMLVAAAGAMEAGTTMYAGAQQIEASGDNTLYLEGVDKMGSAMITALEASSDAADFSSEYRDAMNALDEVLSDLRPIDTVDLAAIQAGRPYLASSALLYLGGSTDAAPFAVTLAHFARHFPTVGPALGSVSYDRPFAEQPDAIRDVAHRLIAIEQLVDRRERQGQPFAHGDLVEACASGQVVGCVEISRWRCDEGDAVGCRIAGTAFELGQGVVEDRDRAGTLLQRACDGGDAEGCMRAAALASGEASHRAFETACALGRADGCYGLAALLVSSGTPDLARVASLFQQSCDGGVAAGCSSLGDVLATVGAGTPEERVLLWSRGCELGDPAGCVSAGAGLIEIGALDDAAILLEVGCRAGRLDGCERLGLLHADQRNAPDAALGPLSVACDGGVHTACAHIGDVSVRLGEGEQALAAWSRACDAGVGWSCTRLGDALRGHLDSDSAIGAAAAYQRACHLEDLAGCFGLASAYELGSGVVADPAKATELYAKACAGGLATACQGGAR